MVHNPPHTHAHSHNVHIHQGQLNCMLCVSCSENNLVQKVTAVGTLVAGGVALWQLKEAMQEELPSNKGAWSPASGMVAAGFLVGVAAFAFVADATAILFRFINIGYCNLKIRTLLVVVGLGTGGDGDRFCNKYNRTHLGTPGYSWILLGTPGYSWVLSK